MNPITNFYHKERERLMEDKPDSIVSSVITKYEQRAGIGKEKYGVTLDREDLNLMQWLNHLQEELMDATLYIEKLKTEAFTNQECSQNVNKSKI